MKIIRLNECIISVLTWIAVKCNGNLGYLEGEHSLCKVWRNVEAKEKILKRNTPCAPL